MPGASEPPPATCVTPQSAPVLLARAPDAWKQSLELIASLVQVRGCRIDCEEKKENKTA
jgi:hypothetical protein